jgi:phosphoribosylamine--glycine ligase
VKVMVIGGGGREHALCWALAASPLCDELYCAPGNPGIATLGECVEVKADDVEGILTFVQARDIDFVVVGPEQPLVMGLVDRLEQAGIRAFGPTAAAAVLEGSKGFTKDLCAKYGIPTAAYRRFEDATAARAWVRERGRGCVVKADGLAAGKGVIICETAAEAEAAIGEMMEDGAFGEAGAEVVIEDLLIGEEASFFALSDGRNVVPLASAQDHKRVGDGDIGPNTGGMGAYSPAPVMTPELEAQVMERIIRPTVEGMAAEGKPYRGVLYAGLMISAEGPQLIEYNVRFGDPECQVLMLRLQSDLLPALVAACDGVLDAFDLRWRPEAAITVVMAAKGYPGAYEKGSEIVGLDRAGADPDVTIFHAGTSAANGRLLATGGRVLNVCATGANVTEAQARAYAAIGKIDWPGGFCRHDIGWRAIEREAGKG